MVADAPLALYNHFFIMLFTALHSVLQEPHYFTAAIFPFISLWHLRFQLCHTGDCMEGLEAGNA